MVYLNKSDIITHFGVTMFPNNFSKISKENKNSALGTCHVAVLKTVFRLVIRQPHAALAVRCLELFFDACSNFTEKEISFMLIQ